MGVHGLWSVLAPAGHTMPLSRLAGRTLAVDLSGWVCQAFTTKPLALAVQKPHLRNLFFRVSTFYRLGANLVFVIDGVATPLKWTTLDRREREREGERREIGERGKEREGERREIGERGKEREGERRGRGERGKEREGERRGRGERGRDRGRQREREDRTTGRRPQLQRYVNECCNLLDCLGVPYIQSSGEAEALCSLLNSTGVADGVLTNDSDAFLYGATTVFRDLSTTDKCASVDCYTMKDIQDVLGLNRTDLVALALLLGCDYCPEGVVGVGSGKALQFLRAHKSQQASPDILEQFRQWRLGNITEGDLESKIEQLIFRRAMACPGFPQEEVIGEFMSTAPPLTVDRDTLTTWRAPRLSSTQVFCRQHMDWSPSYTAEKMAPLITEWAIREAVRGDTPTTVSPSRVVKMCKVNGESCYQVQWQSSPHRPSDDRDDIFSAGNMVTIECKEDMERAFPAVCTAYRDRLAAEARAKAEQKELDRALAKKQREEQKELAKKQREEQKELDRALAKKQREEKRAARKANKSPPKMPVPTSPSSHLPQILHHLTLASPTSDSLQTVQPSMSSSALHRHMCTNTVQETENTYMYVDLDSSTESDTEEVPTTSLRERISARKLTLCSASQDQLIQTSLSTAQSVCKASQRSNSPSQCDVRAHVSTSDEQPTMSPTKRDGLTLICHPSPKRLSLSASSDDKVNSVMGKGTAYDPIVL